MKFWRNVRELARMKDFRKLLAVRVVTQASDGTLQVGMASYVLFSPTSQPDATGILMVLAITLLPFAFVGPFVSTVLDRWSRQRMIVVVDSLRALIALGVAALVASGDRSAPVQTLLFVLLLIALSANRLLLAGLSAGMAYTVDRKDFLTASSIMPMIGPAGVMIGGGIAGGIRLVLAPRYMDTHHADAIVFCVAAVMFLTSVTLGLQFAKHDLGPEPGTAVPRASQALRDMGDALKHISRRPVVALGLQVITAQRVLFGLISVAVILGYRNSFHQVNEVNAAIVDIGIWGVFSGVGFVLSATLAPPLVHRFGLRRTLLMLLLASAVCQIVPGSIFRRIALLIAAFGIGLFAQSIKIVVDTTVQLHVRDEFKGRVFVVYDILFNAAMVLAALIAVFIVPPYGFSRPVFIGVGVAYALLGGYFWWRSSRIGNDAYNHADPDVSAPASVGDGVESTDRGPASPEPIS